MNLLICHNPSEITNKKEKNNNPHAIKKMIPEPFQNSLHSCCDLYIIMPSINSFGIHQFTVHKSDNLLKFNSACYSHIYVDLSRVCVSKSSNMCAFISFM